MRKGLLTAFGVILFFSASVFAQISGWITTSASNGAGLGNNPSLVIDHEGFVHILHTALSDNKLRYSTNRMGNGAFETKPISFVGANPLLSMLPRLDGAMTIRGDQLIVCYYQATNHRLEYMEKNIDAANFSVPIVLDNNSPDIGKNCSIAIDGSNGVHISYWDETNKKVKYLYRPSNPAQNLGPLTLTPSAATTHVGPWNSIAIHPNGTAHVAYYYDRLVPPQGNPLINQLLIYSSKVLNSNVFPESIIGIQGATGNADPDFGKFSSAAVDASNKFHVCYFENNNGDLKLRYATNETIADNQSDWPNVILTENPPQEGRYCSMAFEAGRVHIAYVEQIAGGSQQILYRSKAPLEPLSEPQTVTLGNIADIDLFVERTTGKAHITYLMPFPNLNLLRYARGVLCGDAVCEGQETCKTCEGDCGVCLISQPTSQTTQVGSTTPTGETPADAGGGTEQGTEDTGAGAGGGGGCQLILPRN